MDVIERDPPDYNFGSPVWPGLAKVIEECGEVLQIAGQIVAFPAGNHPSGVDIVARMNNEIADLAAAIQFLVAENGTIDTTGFVLRRDAKLRLFQGWHERG